MAAGEMVSFCRRAAERARDAPRARGPAAHQGDALLRRRGRAVEAAPAAPVGAAAALAAAAGLAAGRAPPTAAGSASAAVAAAATAWATSTTRTRLPRAGEMLEVEDEVGEPAVMERAG